ncbi:MAG: hypothetical protein LBR53_13490 [Deltaproteobacteria bacterium]|nr:hypothetical protein [Deltaproteobacteria bacterium]
MDFPIKEVILVQIILEVCLLVLLILVLFRTARRDKNAPAPSLPLETQSSISRFITESENISQSFTRNLEDKKKISSDLISKLDDRLESYRALLAETEAAVEKASRRLDELQSEGRRMSALRSDSDQKANPAAPEVRALVLKLHREGLSVEDIATRARLHRGEVELIISLDRGL